RNLPDVDRQDPPRVFADDLAVDLRISLSAVADEDEAEVRVGVEDRPDAAELVLDARPLEQLAPVDAEVAQEERPRRDRVELHELHEQVVEVPRAARHE